MADFDYIEPNRRVVKGGLFGTGSNAHPHPYIRPYDVKTPIPHGTDETKGSWGKDPSGHDRVIKPLKGGTVYTKSAKSAARGVGKGLVNRGGW